MLPLYTISLGALYHKILRPFLKNADFVFAFVRQLLLLLFFENGWLHPFDDFCVAYIYYFVNITLQNCWRQENFFKIVHLYVFISFWLKYEVNLTAEVESK